jgi:hypothetical protein
MSFNLCHILIHPSWMNKKCHDTLLKPINLANPSWLSVIPDIKIFLLINTDQTTQCHILHKT